MKGYKKCSVYANLEKEDSIPKEFSFTLIPPPEERQLDLQYVSAVFVSSGFNLNKAYFLPSELIKARDTIVNKPLDIEHKQEKIVGHLYKSVFAYKDGSMFDPVELASTVGNEVDKVSMDILMAGYVYKARFPELAEEVASGKYGVSMECYYKDYDLIVNNIIIPRLEAKKVGLVDALGKSLGKKIKVVEGEIEKGTHKVGRVLRGMLFSGCGFVETPANPDSVILETAGKDSGYILDLTKIDSYMKAKQEDERIVVHSLEDKEKDLAYLSSSYGGIHKHEVSSEGKVSGGEHAHLVHPNDIPNEYSVLFDSNGGSHSHTIELSSGSVLTEENHVHKYYIKEGNNINVYESGPSVDIQGHEISSGSRETSFSGSHYHEIKLEDGTIVKTLTPKDILESIQEEAGLGYVGIEQSPRPEICASFRRYVYEKGGDNPGVPDNSRDYEGMVPRVESYPAPTGGGAGDAAAPGDRIIHENWCTIFERDCPVPGGQSTHRDCWKNVLGRITKEEISRFMDELEKSRENARLSEKITTLQELIREASKLL